MRLGMVMALALVLGACNDEDGDGQGPGRDCDDADPRVFAGAVEICNGRDDDCNGQVDEGVAFVAWQDRDGDGFGDPARARRVCALPDDGVENGDDCDDRDATTFPGAEERCDGADNDCDQEVDEDVGATFFLDGDGDGHGVPDATTTACVVPAGYSRVDDDCDDADPLRWTDAPEACDGVDNDCDGEIDEGLEDRALHVDADRDGYGDPSAWARGCGAAPGLSENGLDCDDADPALNPDTPELEGNLVDDDCDGWVDELAVPDAFPTLAAALAVAVDGDVVQLGAGVFPGTFDLTGRDLSFVGEGCERTLLYGDGSGLGTTLIMDAGLVADMTITGGTDAGLRTLGDMEGRGLCIVDNYAPRFGGGLEVEAGTLVLEDSLIAGNEARSEGAGVHVDRDGELIGRRLRVLDNETQEDGGGIAVRSGRLELFASVIAGNEAYDDGGGLIMRQQVNADPPGPPPSVLLRNVTLHANRLGAASTILWRQSGGPAIYAVSGGLLRLENSVVSGHDYPDHPPVFTPTPSLLALDRVALFDNGAVDTRDGYVSGALRGDPGYTDVSGADPRAWDLRPSPGSALVDAGDPAILDLDGSRSDLGATGGPWASADAADPLRADRDGDGLNDVWERRHGLSWWLDDAASDPDGDGLDNAAEQAAGADPRRADSDDDGADDAVEVARGSDAAFAGDGLPFAAVSPTHAWLVGDTVTVDGGASFDPDGVTLASTWGLTDPAGGAAVISGAGLAASFVPDRPGTWVVSLTVDDGHAADTDLLHVEVVAPDVIVPDDLPLEDAVLAATGGELIAVRPGEYTAGLTFGGLVVDVVGLGFADEVVVRSPGGHTAYVGGGADVSLRHLTLADGVSLLGGGLYCLESTVELVDVVLRDNEATFSYGGGGYFLDCDVSATRLEVRDNVAARDGGGLYLDESEREIGLRTWLRDVRLVGNAADDRGGALYLRQWRGSYDLRQLVVQANTAAEGAGVFLEGTDPLSSLYVTTTGRGDEPGTALVVAIEQAVFADNASGGAIVFADGARARLVAPLFAWNTAVGAVVDHDGAALTSMHPAFWANGAAAWGHPSLAPPLTWNVDPAVLQFSDDQDPSNDVWTLRPGSPLLDRGLPERRDVDGSPSDVGPGGGVDMPRTWRMDAFDGDGDGMSDGWERRFGLDPRVDDAALDRDGDGASNLAEYEAGTTP